MPTLIQFARSHTIQFATAVTALGVVQQVGAFVIPAEYQGMAMSAIGLAIAALRFITNKALSEK